MLVTSEAMVLILIDWFGGQSRLLCRRALIKLTKPHPRAIFISVPTSSVSGKGSSFVVSLRVPPLGLVSGVIPTFGNVWFVWL